ncbi:MAG: 16S rRNA (guanine(527)-N(7))-methyltransferase RsmG [Tissierellia bacterium]|nr:16S rRNA (guanine(527)-N(7))-methyltransferase RsmG [Tissierellia bacterium]
MKWLKEGLELWDIELSPTQEKEFESYRDMILEWNEKFNITSLTEEKDMEIKHFLDSISPLLLKELETTSSVLDMGTGGGFPGIPLKIMKPEWKMVLADSLNKRIKFLQEVISELKLKDIEAVHGRAEEMARKSEFREKFDMVISRAVAPLPTLAEYCIPFVKVGGFFIAMKGSAAEEELEQAEKAIKILGGKYVRKETINIPHLDWQPQLLIIKKVEKTHSKYPRGGGKPRTKPL